MRSQWFSVVSLGLEVRIEAVVMALKEKEKSLSLVCWGRALASARKKASESFTLVCRGKVSVLGSLSCRQKASD